MRNKGHINTKTEGQILRRKDSSSNGLYLALGKDLLHCPSLSLPRSGALSANGLEGSGFLSIGKGTIGPGVGGEENELINVGLLVEDIYHVFPCGWLEVGLLIPDI